MLMNESFVIAVFLSVEIVFPLVPSFSTNFEPVVDYADSFNSTLL